MDTTILTMGIVYMDLLMDLPMLVEYRSKLTCKEPILQALR